MCVHPMNFLHTMFDIDCTEYITCTPIIIFRILLALYFLEGDQLMLRMSKIISVNKMQSSVVDLAENTELIEYTIFLADVAPNVSINMAIFS